MKCSDNCGYFWKEEWEDYPCCHYVGPHEWAPCEQEDNYIETDDDSWDNDD